MNVTVGMQPFHPLPSYAHFVGMLHHADACPAISFETCSGPLLPELEQM